jgi:hypothetical protein
VTKSSEVEFLLFDQIETAVCRGLFGDKRQRRRADEDHHRNIWVLLASLRTGRLAAVHATDRHAPVRLQAHNQLANRSDAPSFLVVLERFYRNR